MGRRRYFYGDIKACHSTLRDVWDEYMDIYIKIVELVSVIKVIIHPTNEYCAHTPRSGQSIILEHMTSCHTWL